MTEVNPGSSSAGNYSIDGGRPDSVNYVLDDGSLDDNLLDNSVVYNPNPDAIAEFHILESDYSAEYGRNAGGIISIVTKSGTNQFHGSLYDYVRSDAFDANSFFNKLQGLPRDVLKRHQFGATLGGPINKNKLFFFESYQGTRQTVRETPVGFSITPVFTPAELNGDFSHALGPGTGMRAQCARIMERSGRGDSSNSFAIRKNLVDVTGIEPATPCLQSRCSPS